MNRRSKLFKLSIAIVMLVGFMAISIQAVESDFKPVAEEYISSSGISWSPKINYSKLILTISRPDGTVFRKTIESGTTPYANISEIFGENHSDGSYTYELRVIPANLKRSRENKNELAGTRSQKVRNGKALTQTGYFLIQSGAIVTGGMQEPGANKGGGTIASAGSLSTQNRIAGTQDQQILDDLIVDGSACIGQDCVNGESFGFDTIRLKENNLRIRFYDTSNTASFPSNDWQITANDSANGGANKFSIDDIDGGRTPFTIEASAPSHSLYVEDGGRVGFGTSTPVADLHVVNGNTPTLRLEQDGSSGFTAQTWDVAGNEANFFIRDATNGSTLPFRIQPGADTNSIYIEADGDVGIGTNSVKGSFEVKRSSKNASFFVTRNGETEFKVSSRPDDVFFGTNTDDDLVVIAGASNKEVMVFQPSGNVGINYVANVNTALPELFVVGTGAAASYAYSDGTGWFTSSSRKVKENINNLSFDEANEALEGLEPVKFNYISHKEAERVGFIAEDVPDLVATKKRNALNSMDILAVLTKVVKEQQKTITELKEKITALEKKSKK